MGKLHVGKIAAHSSWRDESRHIPLRATDVKKQGWGRNKGCRLSITGPAGLCLEKFCQD